MLSVALYDITLIITNIKMKRIYGAVSRSLLCASRVMELTIKAVVMVTHKH